MKTKLSRFIFSHTPLQGLVRIERQCQTDARGIFERLYCAEEFQTVGFNESIAHINHSKTREAGVVRGLHFQYPPFTEIKIVSCIKGEIFDVAVDLRANSPTYLQWYGERLSEKNQFSFLIPKGFAHGFQTLDIDCELIYLHSAPYAAASEGGLNPTDPQISIKWPLAITSMSERDKTQPHLPINFKGIEVS